MNSLTGKVVVSSRAARSDEPPLAKEEDVS